MNHPLDPIQLQRLIDGECSPDDVRDLLLAARNQSSIWAQIGLALMEDRAWQYQTRFGSSEGHSVTAQPSLVVRNNNPIDGQYDVNSLDKTPANQFTSTDVSKVEQAKHSNPAGSGSRQVPRNLSGSNSMNWFAMAASLLAVAMLSYSAGQHVSRSNGNGGLARQPDASPHSAPLLANNSSPQTTMASLQPDYRMQLPDNDRFQPSGEVPLYVVNSLDQWQQLDRPLPQELRFTPEQLAELNHQGIGVRKELDVLTGQFEDGRTFIVPIRSIRFLPTQ